MELHSKWYFKLWLGKSAAHLECKVLDEVPCVGKARTKFWYRFNDNKIKHRVSEKHIEKYSVNFLTTIIALLHCTKNEEILNGKLNLCAVLGTQKLILFEQCETHKHLKKKETFWQHPLKTFYPLDRNEK